MHMWEEKTVASSNFLGPSTKGMIFHRKNPSTPDHACEDKLIFFSCDGQLEV